MQTSIGLLAEEVRSLAAEEGIALDLDSLDDRRCLADVFLYLSTLGVLVAVAGQAESWVRSRAEGDDELLYDVMHSVLDDLIVAPRVVGAADATDLLVRRRLSRHRGGHEPRAPAPRSRAGWSRTRWSTPSSWTTARSSPAARRSPSGSGSRPSAGARARR